MSKNPKSKLVPVGFYLEEKTLTVLRKQAAEEGRSLSAFMRRHFFSSGVHTPEITKTR
jgi:hypothetical protein